MEISLNARDFTVSGCLNLPPHVITPSGIGKRNAATRWVIPIDDSWEDRANLGARLVSHDHVEVFDNWMAPMMALFTNRGYGSIKSEVFRLLGGL